MQLRRTQSIRIMCHLVINVQELVHIALIRWPRKRNPVNLYDQHINFHHATIRNIMKTGICYPELQNMNTSITSCICTPGACCMRRRFSNTCILIVLIYDLLFKFSCTIEKQKGKLDLKQSTDTAKSHNNQLRITYYVSTRNLQQIIRSKIFYVLIIWDLCKRNKRK